MKHWYPKNNTLIHIAEKTQLLINNFETYLNRFIQLYNNDEIFGGPSLYFHFKTIKSSYNTNVANKLMNEKILEYAYATLGTWGLHRMGKTETKLMNYDKIKCQLEMHRDNIVDLENLNIWEIDLTNIQTKNNIYSKLEPILNNMKISKSNATLVANTKFLHHILPNLIVPIDRNYTLEYFGISKQAPSNYFAFDIFMNLFPRLVEVAESKYDFIQDRINLEEFNWNTSITKIIDNAIVGAVKFT